MCLSHLIYTVWPCLIHTCHATPMPCYDHAILLKATAQHGRRETAMLCRMQVVVLCTTTCMQPFPACIHYLPTQDITYHGNLLGKERGEGGGFYSSNTGWRTMCTNIYTVFFSSSKQMAKEYLDALHSSINFGDITCTNVSCHLSGKHSTSCSQLHFDMEVPLVADYSLSLCQSCRCIFIQTTL